MCLIKKWDEPPLDQCDPNPTKTKKDKRTAERSMISYFTTDYNRTSSSSAISCKKSSTG